MEEKRKPLPIETLPREELEKIQNRRLEYTLRMAYEHSLFWREKFDSLGIKPEDIKNRQDLEIAYEKGLRLTSGDLLTRYDEVLPYYIKNKEIKFIELQSSGFTKPKRIPWPIPPTLSNEVVQLSYNSAGVSPDSRFFNWLSPYPYSSGILSTLALETCFPQTQFMPRWNEETTKPFSTEEAKKILTDFQPTHIMSLPSKIADLTNKLIEEEKCPSDYGVKTILLGGDAISREDAKKIQDIWNAEVYDVMGTTECSLFGYECVDHSGLHITENRIILFTANPESHKVLSKSEKGVDVVTSLYTNEERPGIFIINYSHNDFTRIIDKDKCVCGRTFLKIDYPTRYDDILNIRGVKLNPLEIERTPLVRDYFIIESYDEKELTKKYEIRIIPEFGYSTQEISTLVLKYLYSSNPDAYNLIRGSDITFSICSSSDDLYKGFEIPRGGKKRRLVRRNF